VTDAAVYEGARPREGLLDPSNTARTVWADTAYRSAANKAFLNRAGFVSRIHRKKPKGRPMPEATRRANNAKSKIRSRVEHVFAEQKARMGLVVRTIGIARAKTKIGMANLLYNIRRLAGSRGPLLRSACPCGGTGRPQRPEVPEMPATYTRQTPREPSSRSQQGFFEPSSLMKSIFNIGFVLPILTINTAIDAAPGEAALGAFEEDSREAAAMYAYAEGRGICGRARAMSGL